MMQRSDWILISPGDEDRPGELDPWMRELVESSRALGDGFVELQDIQAGAYTAAVDPHYLTPRLVVAAFFAPGGTYTLALLEESVRQVSEQGQLVQGACKRAVRVPLESSPVNVRELRATVQAAYLSLKEIGVLGDAAI